jgi:hypothetical protein
MVLGCSRCRLCSFNAYGVHVWSVCVYVAWFELLADGVCLYVCHVSLWCSSLVLTPMILPLVCAS